MLEKGRISGRETILLLTGLLMGSATLFTPGIRAEQEIWLAILLGLVEATIIALIYITLLMKFPGKNLVGIAEMVYGTYLGKFISVIFLLYIVHVGSFLIGDFRDFAQMYLLVTTRQDIIITGITLVAVYGVWHGLEVLARVSQALVIMTISLILITIVLLFRTIALHNFLPLFDIPLGQLLWAAHGVATFPFGDSVVFVMILPYLNRSQEIRSSVIKAFLLTALMFMLIALRLVGTLGNSAQLYVFGSMQAVRLVNIADILTRMEIIVSINFIVMGFIAISVMLYSASLGFSQVFGLKSYRMIILPIAILMAVISLANFSGMAASIIFTYEVYPIYALPFQIGIPLITLLVAYLRKLPKEGV